MGMFRKLSDYLIHEHFTMHDKFHATNDKIEELNQMKSKLEVLEHVQ